MLPASVIVNELGPREGIQIEPNPVSTDDKVRLIDMLSECGFPVIQATAFVNQKLVPQMADAEEVVARIKQRPGTKYTAVVLSRNGVRRAMATGKVDLDLSYLLYTSDAFAMKNNNKTAEQSIADIVPEIALWREFGRELDYLAVGTVWGCNFEGAIPQAKVIDTIDRAIKLAKDNGATIRRLLLGDTVGWANPLAVKRMVGAIRERWPELHLNLHFHDTHAMGLANAYAALELGVNEFDASVGGIGGCPFAGHKARLASGNIVTEDLVLMCHEAGIETGIDLERLLEVSNWCEAMLGHTLPGKNMHTGSLESFRRAARAKAQAEMA